MSHLYPLASDALEALNGTSRAARTRAEAEKLAGEAIVTSLETEWLILAKTDAQDMLGQADKGLQTGFVQRYENARGELVLAVTYWKITPERREKPREETQTDPIKPATDHTDDLYFRQGRTKPRRRKKADPNQMDLFLGQKE